MCGFSARMSLYQNGTYSERGVWALEKHTTKLAFSGRMHTLISPKIPSSICRPSASHWHLHLVRKLHRYILRLPVCVQYGLVYPHCNLTYNFGINSYLCRSRFLMISESYQNTAGKGGREEPCRCQTSGWLMMSYGVDARWGPRPSHAIRFSMP